MWSNAINGLMCFLFYFIYLNNKIQVTPHVLTGLSGIKISPLSMPTAGSKAIDWPLVICLADKLNIEPSERKLLIVH